MKHSEARCDEQYVSCREPIPRADLTCEESNADTICHGSVCTNPDTSTAEDCCKQTEIGKGICFCGPFEYVVVAPNRGECWETAWPNEGTPCDDPNCRVTCGSHTFGSEYDTCIASDSDPDYCCCKPMCARFLVPAIDGGCNEVACVAACLLQGFLAQNANKCLDDRCCCHQQWVPQE